MNKLEEYYASKLGGGENLRGYESTHITGDGIIVTVKYLPIRCLEDIRVGVEIAHRKTTEA